MNIERLLIFLTLLLVCCNNTETKQEISKNKNIKAPIDKNLESKIARFINERTTQNTDNNIVFTVKFSYHANFKNPNSKDSCILISTLNCVDKKSGYKGVLNIENHRVAFFDTTGFGPDFYENYTFKKTPIDSLNCLDEKYILIATYLIKNRELELLY